MGFPLDSVYDKTHANVPEKEKAARRIGGQLLRKKIQGREGHGILPWVDSEFIFRRELSPVAGRTAHIGRIHGDLIAGENLGDGSGYRLEKLRHYLPLRFWRVTAVGLKVSTMLVGIAYILKYLHNTGCGRCRFGYQFLFCIGTEGSGSVKHRG